jgi:predicted esterase YcpF (UPF0227 family)
MRTAFFHGLESPPVSEKNAILDKHFTDVYAPPMDYRDPGLFSRVLQEVTEKRPDVLIGSSMGGWFAYCLSTVTGIPTLLFNPACVGRSFNPIIETGKELPQQTIILGKYDDVINHQESMSWLVDNYHGPMSFTYEGIGHRIPADIFEKQIEKFIKKTNK